MSLAVHINGDGPNLTLVHGWGMGSDALDNLALALGEGFTVNRVDLPGYGDSPPMSPLSLDALADALAATLPPRAMLCGWSLGAMACLACAARHPRLVARLVLVGATASFTVREGWHEAMPLAQFADFRAAVAKDGAAQLKRFASLIHLGAQRPREAQRYLCMRAAAPPTAVLLDSLDALATIDLRPLLHNVRQPVLLVHGDADPLMPLAAAQRLHTLLPNAELDIFPGSAHAPFACEPERFIASVRRFAGLDE